ncbi:outer spore coat protein CotE [Gottfriedia acidiceleris]|uniref:outer spore coat protein CotE n=1 Tax=Gottfriedia acidiceleris TaxID=371036 RepID=UPI002FFE4AB2
MSEREHREIITKAVVGRGKKYNKVTHTITPNHTPSSILGCWVINHVYDAKKCKDGVEVSGKYDINIWYSHGDNTKTEVVPESVKYHEVVKLRHRDENFTGEDCEVIARSLKHPNCLDAIISPNGNRFIVTVEKEVLVEVVGETKIVVLVSPHGVHDDDDFFDVDDEFEDLDPDFVLEGEEE